MNDLAEAEECTLEVPSVLTDLGPMSVQTKGSWSGMFTESSIATYRYF